MLCPKSEAQSNFIVLKFGHYLTSQHCKVNPPMIPIELSNIFRSKERMKKAIIR